MATDSQIILNTEAEKDLYKTIFLWAEIYEHTDLYRKCLQRIREDKSEAMTRLKEEARENIQPLLATNQLIEAQRKIEISRIDTTLSFSPDDPDWVIRNQLKIRFGKDPKDIKLSHYDGLSASQMSKLTEAQIESVAQIMKSDFFDQDYEQDDANNDLKAESIRNMETINNMNWQWQICSPDGHENALSCFEGMVIGAQQENIRKDSVTSKRLSLPMMKMQVNMYSLVIENELGEIRLLKKAANNNREERLRPDQSQRAYEQGLSRQDANGQYFPTEFGAYGQMFVIDIKDDISYWPTFNELVESLSKWFFGQMETKMHNKSQQEQLAIKKMYKTTFNDLVLATNIINKDDKVKPYHIKHELSLVNPYSKICCFIMYLYSSEFGNPPLYAELNRVCREMDKTYLEQLGPFSKCMAMCLEQGEKERSVDDRRKSGIQFYMEYRPHMEGWNMAGCLYIWRGVKLTNAQLIPWEQNSQTCKEVLLPGSSSCSFDLKVAIEFAFKDGKPEQKPTLFAFLIQNYFCPKGISMNNKALTAFPNEKEILLAEGTNVYILGVDKDVQIQNDYPSFAPFNQKHITIIYLYHCF